MQQVLRGQPLVGMELAELEDLLGPQQPAFRARQIYDALYRKQVANLSECSNLPKALRTELFASNSLGLLALEQRFDSIDGTRRYLLRLHDNRTVETVLMPEPGRNTICISSQVGCPVDCKFCLTALMGLERNLTAGEIVGQVLHVARENGLAPSDSRLNIVMMGMGEPLLNLDNVLKATRLLTDELGVGLSPKRITVSTSGIVPKMYELAKADIRPKLAISLNASTEEQRQALMPITRKYHLSELMEACREYPLRPWERLTFEYVLLRDVNDSDADAKRVVRLIANLNCKVNLIALNPGPGIRFETPLPERVESFQAIVRKAVPCFVRKPRGRDIYAACGQLKRAASDLRYRRPGLSESTPPESVGSVVVWSGELISPENSREGPMTRENPVRSLADASVVVGAFLLVGLFFPLLEAQVNPDVTVRLNGAPVGVGTYSFPFPAGSSGLTLDNGLVQFRFNGKTATSQTMLALSIIANGQQLAPLDGQNSFYVDASGGTPSLVCSEVRVLRNTPDLAEVAFVDTTTSTLRPEHHLIMRRGKRGIYGYVIENAVSPFSISELRVVTRWNRTLLDHIFNWERGSPDAPGTAANGQTPVSAYLATQASLQDQTWRVDGINNPTVQPPDSNSGNLAPDSVYSKYIWSLYHSENPFFGHFGHGYGAWFVSLGGVTDSTLCASYGVGPNHQDLAVHEDAIIINYFGANHYGLPSYPLPTGYRRLYGPWYFFVTVGDPANPRGVLQDANAVAQAEIAENRPGSDWISDPLYPAPSQRTTVTGRLRITDGRPADNLWVLLSTQNVTDVYTIHEPTYFVRTDANGNFSLPGVPAPWTPGTTNPGTYTLYAFSNKGSIIDQYKQTGITFQGPTLDLGTMDWTPVDHTTFLWQIGKADRNGGEFALATNPVDGSNPRDYDKPSRVPGNLTYTVGSSWEPQDWYYAQTNPGTWTISFNLNRTYTGTAFFTVSTSMQQGGVPTVAVNGASSGISGSLPANNDSTISRQADRSGYPRSAVLSFPASMLHTGANTITLTRGSATAAGNGLGWDTLLLEVNEPTAPAPAQLVGRVAAISATPSNNTLTLQIINAGRGDANDIRLDGVTFPRANGTVMPSVIGRDPNRLPIPVAPNIPPGASASVNLQFDFTKTPEMGFNAVIPFSANGGKARGTLSANIAPAVDGSVTLKVSSVLQKQPNGSYLQFFTVENEGTGTAANVELKSATLGGIRGSSLPTIIGNIAPGGSLAVATISFPSSVGTSGTAVTESYVGTYKGGSFKQTIVATLP